MTHVSPPSPRRRALYRTVPTRNLASVSRVFRVRIGQRVGQQSRISMPRNPWVIPPQRARIAIFAGASLVEPTGIEPVTSCLQSACDDARRYLETREDPGHLADRRLSATTQDPSKSEGFRALTGRWRPIG